MSSDKQELTQPQDCTKRMFLERAITPSEEIKKSTNGLNVGSTGLTSTVHHDHRRICVKFAFPFKLQAMLDDAQSNRLESIVAWQPHGLAFRIHDIKLFSTVVMPKYFDKTKYRSFQRQLHIYGFRRVSERQSPDYGSYFHNLFRRGQSQLCLAMKRKKIKGLSSSSSSSSGKKNEEKIPKNAHLTTNVEALDSARITQGVLESVSGSTVALSPFQPPKAALLGLFEPTPIHPRLDFCCLESSSSNTKEDQAQIDIARSIEPIRIPSKDFHGREIFEDLFGGLRSFVAERYFFTSETTL